MKIKTSELTGMLLDWAVAHTTPEAAEAHAKAMLGIDPEWRRDES